MRQTLAYVLLVSILGTFHSTEGYVSPPFHLHGAKYSYREYDSITTKDAILTVSANKLGIALPPNTSLSFTVPEGSRLTGPLVCTDAQNVVIPAKDISLESGLYKITTTYTRGMKPEEAVSVSCGPITVPRSIYDPNTDWPEVSVESEGRTFFKSKLPVSVPYLPISTATAVVRFSKPPGVAGSMTFEFPTSYLALDEPMVHYYFTVEFPGATRILNPLGQRDQQTCYDPVNPDRFYVASAYLDAMNHILQYRVDFHLGVTVPEHQTFQVRVPGIITPTYAYDWSKTILVKMYGANDQVIGMQVMLPTVDTKN